MPTLETVFFCGTCGEEMGLQIFESAPDHIKTEADIAVEITCRKCADRIVDLQNQALVPEEDVRKWETLMRDKNAQITDLTKRLAEVTTANAELEGKYRLDTDDGAITV